MTPPPPPTKLEAEKEIRQKCRWCGESNGVMKYFILADDLENPKPYHPACIRQLKLEVIMKLSDSKALIDGMEIK